MMITDVEERTYEFAMLRTLGYKKSSLIVLLVLQALFFSVPATALGFVINYLFTSLAQLLLYWYAGIRLQVQLNQSTIILGLFTGILVPLISNIYPIKQALNSTLRDALDRSRKGVDDLEVQVLRLENSGCNLVQVAGGFVVVGISFLTLYVIPNNVMSMESNTAYFNLNLLLIAVILGIILMS